MTTQQGIYYGKKNTANQVCSGYLVFPFVFWLLLFAVFITLMFWFILRHSITNFIK